MRNLTLALITGILAFPRISFANTAETVVAQICSDGYKITYRLGVFFIRRADGTVQRIVSDSEKTGHSASFQITWDANPNGLGGAMIFPNDSTLPAIECNKVN